MLCDYGCGQEATHQFKNGKWCCSKYTSQCSVQKQIISKAGKGRTPWNKGKNIFNEEEKIEMRKKIKSLNLIPWNKDKKNVYSKLTLKKMKNVKKDYVGYWNGKNRSIKTKLKISNNLKSSIEQIKEKYPTFAKVEEMRYEPGKENEKVIQVHCKNHNCKNSKELGGWFTPKNNDIILSRAWAIEKIDGNEASYMYCSNKCKQTCPLYWKKIEINKYKTDLYTSEEYQTWRNEVLKRANYLCEYCEKPATDVHHSRPQKLEPGFVLDPDFGVACCESCHYKYGHKTGTECSTGNLANKECL